MTSKHRTDRDRVHRPFADPLDTFNETSRRPSRTQRRRAESARRQQAERDVDRLAAGHHTPRGRRLLTYGLLTIAVTIIGWRMMHWLVWAYDPAGAVSYRITALPSPGGYAGRTPAEIAASGLATQPEPAGWIDPVGLVVGLALGLVITWMYARYFQNL